MKTSSSVREAMTGLHSNVAVSHPEFKFWFSELNFIGFKLFIYLFVYLECVSVSGGERTTHGSQFSPTVLGPRDSAQVICLGGRLLYLLSHLASPRTVF